MNDEGNSQVTPTNPPVPAPPSDALITSEPLPPTPAPEPSMEPKSTEPAPITISAADLPAKPVETPKAPIAPVEPVAEEPVANTENLANQVEILTGEVQALESKIEQMVATAKPVTEPTSALEEKPAVAPIAQDVAAPESAPAPLPAIPPVEKDAMGEVVPKTVPPVSPAAPADPTKVPPPNLPLNDIYPKADTFVRSNPDMNPLPVATSQPERHDSLIGTIGEVLGAIGMTVLFAFILSPFYKGIFSATLWDALKLIGWVTSTATLFLGFLFSLFSPRKITLKVLLFICFIISLLLLLGVDGGGAIKTTLDNYLGQYLAYFR